MREARFSIKNPEFIGKPVRVEVYSASSEVELFLNRKSLGRAGAGKENRFKAVFEVIYEPGTLMAVSYEAGQEISRQALVAPEEPAGLRIRLENDCVKADGQSLLYGIAEIIDRNGRQVQNRDRKLQVFLEGEAAELAAFGTGAPVTEENYTTGEFTSYEGRALFILRAGYVPGEVKVHVRGEGLEDASASVCVLQ